jgi:hypothetical protein
MHEIECAPDVALGPPSEAISPLRTKLAKILGGDDLRGPGNRPALVHNAHGRSIEGDSPGQGFSIIIFLIRIAFTCRFRAGAVCHRKVNALRSVLSAPSKTLTDKQPLKVPWRNFRACEARL